MEPSKEGDCYEISIEASAPPETIEMVRENATDVIDGIFDGYEEARWNTADGKRPTPEEVQDSARLVRPLKIEFQDKLRGDQNAATQAIARGGTLGCDSVTYSDDELLEKGKRYVFFLMPINDSRNEPSQDLLTFAAWPVSEEGKVAVPSDGEVTLANLKDAIENGVKPAVPPSPGEPEETTP